MCNPIAALIAQARHALVGGATEGANPSAAYALGGWEYIAIPLGIIALRLRARRVGLQPRGAPDRGEPVSMTGMEAAQSAPTE